MKPLITIFLLFGLLAQNLNRIIIFAGFMGHRQEITSLYCVNKTRPIMRCGGKCHLKKQLAELDKKEKKESRSTQEIREMSGTEMGSAKRFKFYRTAGQRVWLRNEIDTTAPFEGSIFHPPPQA